MIDDYAVHMYKFRIGCLTFRVPPWKQRVKMRYFERESDADIYVNDTSTIEHINVEHLNVVNEKIFQYSYEELCVFRSVNINK
jgi:hypothetical protein